jgi:hypothetical protein
MILVERALVLGYRLQRLPQRRERPAVRGVAVRHRDHIPARVVDLRMDRESRLIDMEAALHHLPRPVRQHQVADPDMRERHPEGVHPEMVGELRIAGGDVAGHPLVVAELPEGAQRGGQALLAVAALVGGVGEGGGEGEVELVGGDGRRRGLGHAAEVTARYVR